MSSGVTVLLIAYGAGTPILAIGVTVWALWRARRERHQLERPAVVPDRERSAA